LGGERVENRSSQSITAPSRPALPGAESADPDLARERSRSDLRAYGRRLPTLQGDGHRGRL